MSIIQAKIIGSQVWTTENLTALQYQIITGNRIKVNNEHWEESSPQVCSYESSFYKSKKMYLFNSAAARELTLFNDRKNWRLPTNRDFDILFQTIDPESSLDLPSELVAKALRGTYGWPQNGTNKIGFNAYPNPSRNMFGRLYESEIARWWLYDKKRNSFDGVALYNDIDVIATCTPNSHSGFAIRLVMDLQEPRIEKGLKYI